MSSEATWRYHLQGEGTGALVLRSDPPPPPGPGQVLIHMRANALNARDLMVLDGVLKSRPGVVPLSDGAGLVAAVGEGVTRVAVGDPVVAAFRQGWIDGPLDPALRGAADLGCARDGMLGEWALLDAEGVVKIPPGLGFEDAACFPCAGVTAWRALMDGTPVAAGQTVLVMGGGGVSLFALQIARMAGARVIATTSSAAKAARLTALGADETINYVAEPAWDEAVLALTGGLGVDRIVEVGGSGTLARSIRCTRVEGVISLVGLLAKPDLIDPTGVMARALVLKGASVGSRADLEAALQAYAQDGRPPVIDSSFPFDRAGDAIARLRSRDHFGKIAITYPQMAA